MNVIKGAPWRKKMDTIKLTLLLTFLPLIGTVIKGIITVIDDQPFQVSLFCDGNFMGSGIIVNNKTIVTTSSIVALASEMQRLSSVWMCAIAFAAGQTQIHIEPKVVGGERIEIINATYQAALLHFGNVFCGGTILSHKTIVTAAHCVFELRNDLYIRAGSSIYSEGGQKVEVDKVIPHELYDNTNQDYDIAILKLKESLKYNERINPVKLPDEDFYPSPGTSVYVSGWGVTNANSETPEKVLRGAEVKIIEHGICEQKYKGRNVITDRMICAVSGIGSDACQGDSGGPLVAGKVLVGVVSFGIGCADPNFPGIYTNVKEVLPWIMSHLQGTPKVLDPTSHEEKHIFFNPWVYIPVTIVIILIIVIATAITYKMCTGKRVQKRKAREEVELNPRKTQEDN